MSAPTETITVDVDHYNAAWNLASARHSYRQAVRDVLEGAKHLDGLLEGGHSHGSTLSLVTDAGRVHGFAAELIQACNAASATGLPTETITHIRLGGAIA